MQVRLFDGPRAPFRAVKVFSATMAEPRSRLGEDVTAWIHAHPENEIVDLIQCQSSDNAFHCVTIILFLRDPIARRP